MQYDKRQTSMIWSKFRSSNSISNKKYTYSGIIVNLVHIIIRSNNNYKSNEKIKTKVRKKFETINHDVL